MLAPPEAPTFSVVQSRGHAEPNWQHVWPIRKAVFWGGLGFQPSVEQIGKTTAEDGLPATVHFVVYKDSDAAEAGSGTTKKGEAVGVSRLRAVGPFWRVERVAVLASYRGFGLGGRLIRAMHTFTDGPGEPLLPMLFADEDAVGFYQRYGYTVVPRDAAAPGVPYTLPLESVTARPHHCLVRLPTTAHAIAPLVANLRATQTRVSEGTECVVTDANDLLLLPMIIRWVEAALDSAGRVAQGEGGTTE